MANIVFVHGLDNKPEAGYLYQLWKRKLAHDGGLDLDTYGVSSSMNYWADVFYESPTDVHVVSRNASATKPAKLLVFYVKDKGSPPTVLVHDHK